MKPSEIEKINQFSLQICGSKSSQNLFKNNIIPYFGYFNVDIFDCPDFTMFTNNDCPRSRQILCEKSFENTSMRIWCSLIKSATSTIDIGAHVGVYTLATAASGVKNIFIMNQIHKHSKDWESILTLMDSIGSLFSGRQFQMNRDMWNSAMYLKIPQIFHQAVELEAITTQKTLR